VFPSLSGLALGTFGLNLALVCNGWHPWPWLLVISYGATLLLAGLAWFCWHSRDLWHGIARDQAEHMRSMREHIDEQRRVLREQAGVLDDFADAGPQERMFLWLQRANHN
jgi:hypothetical protein